MATVRLAWTAPTTREDGTPLEVPLSYQLYDLSGAEPAALAAFPGVLNPDGDYEHEFDGAEAGRTYQFALTAVDTETGAESAFSNVIEVAVPFAPPAPPVLLRAEIV